MRRELYLSVGEKDILEKIVGYGGYVTKDILALYRQDITTDRCYRILRQLEAKGLLRQREYFKSFRKPVVFQVTRKACNYFGRPNAYMRRIHKPYAVRRYLIRAHFLFQLAGLDISTHLFSSVSREAFLKEKGFSRWHLPKKWTKNIESVQMEEYILENDIFSPIGQICFLYVDDSRYAISTQMKNLLSKYQRMKDAGIYHLTFVIVTETQYRAECFIEVLKEKFPMMESEIQVKFICYKYQCEMC